MGMNAHGHLAQLAAALITAMLLAPMVQAAPPDGFADVVDRVRPAVVNIAAMQGPVSQAPPRQEEALPAQLGSPLEDLLRRFLDPFGDDDDSERGSPTSLGSGFIIDASGLVVTSAHVIQNATRVKVTLNDGRKYRSRLLGRDEETDIAVLQIESQESLPFVVWGDSDASRVGDWVIAVGNPFGLGGTVTVGVISGRGRDIQSGRFDDYLQLDAAINRGNSGGPSFDLTGRVIGINSAIYSTGGGNIGIGFATPSSIAKPVVEELLRHGQVERGWLGAAVQPVTREIADSLALKAEAGALVTTVVPDGPAADAGVQPGDVVLSVNGTIVDRSRDLPRLVAAARPGRTVRLRIWRDGAELAAEVTLMRVPGTAAGTSGAPVARSGPTVTAILGLQLLPITPDMRQRFGLPDDARGALVVGAQGVSGVLPGDIIARVGRKAVLAPLDVVGGVSEARVAGRKAVLLLVRRLGAERFIALPLPG